MTLQEYRAAQSLKWIKANRARLRSEFWAAKAISGPLSAETNQPPIRASDADLRAERPAVAERGPVQRPSAAAA